MTDGVSLEINKRKHILEKKGYKTALLAGPGSSGADYIIPSLDFNTPEAREIADKAFSGTDSCGNESDLIKNITDLSEKIKTESAEILNDFKPDFIFIHNIFSHGRHISAALAFRELLEKYRIRALATHHDFYWEREHYKKPCGKEIDKYLKRNVPPEISGLKHAVINSPAAADLKKRRGINSMIFPDTIDFDAPPWKIDSWNRSLTDDAGLKKDDIIVLQATRIVPRKGIELIVPIIKKLNSPEIINSLIGKKIYNGKLISEKSRFVLFLAGYPEEDAADYWKKLKNYIDFEKIPHVVFFDRVAAERYENNSGKTYSLFDTYPFADLVSYPSIFEGWGNQFLEAVFAEKPIAVFEYPVFKSDIKKQGYSYISLGDTVKKKEDGLLYLPEEIINKAAENIISVLKSSSTKETLRKNFEIGRKNNSYRTLEKLLEKGMAPL